MFANPDSIVAKIVTVLGLIIILVSIIAEPFCISWRNLYEYLLMLIFIFGGAITLKMLFSKKINIQNHRKCLIVISQTGLGII